MYQKGESEGGKRTEEWAIPKKNQTTLLRSSKELSRTKLIIRGRIQKKRN